jgi:hypothetical protein
MNTIVKTALSISLILVTIVSCNKNNHEDLSPSTTSSNEKVFTFSSEKNSLSRFSNLLHYSKLSNGKLRLSNFSAHKTLLILCSNGKDRYQQKAS